MEYAEILHANVELVGKVITVTLKVHVKMIVINMEFVLK
jgi:hypothetical protein